MDNPIVVAVTMLVAIVTFGNILDNRMRPEVKEQLGLWLNRKVSINPESVIQTISNSFLNIFDILYGNARASASQFFNTYGNRYRAYYRYNSLSFSLSDALWGAILLTLPTLIGIRFTTFGFNPLTSEQISSLFLFAITFASLWAILAYCVNRATGGLRSTLIAFIFIHFFLGFFNIVPSLWDIGIGINKYIFSDFDPLSGTFCGEQASTRCNLTLFLISIITIIVPLLIWMSANYWIRSRLLVNPFKAILSSLIFMVIIGAIHREAATSFFDSIEKEGLLTIGFLAFNTYADTISMLETRWILHRGSRAGTPMLVALLILDVLASAMIFLVLPTIMGELPSFMEAVLFKGERPWLGILFWTTFSTSFIFYAYTLTALTIRSQSTLARVIRWAIIPFDLEKQPVFSISIIIGGISFAGLLAKAVLG